MNFKFKHYINSLGELILPIFPETVGVALQYLFATVRAPEVKSDGFTYVKDEANKGTDRLQLQGVSGVFDGVDGKVTIGNVLNTQYVSVWVKQSIDNQILFSLANSTATAVSVVAGVLTFGGSLTVNNIYVDGVSNTVVEAGVILNDNLVHHLYIDYTQIDSSNLVIGFDGTTYGNIELFDFRVGNAVEPIGDVNIVYDNPNALFGSETGMWHLDEGSGLTAFDSSGNSQHGTISGGFSFGMQNVVSFQNMMGYSLMGYSDGTNTNSIVLNSINVIGGEFEYIIKGFFVGDSYISGLSTINYLRFRGHDCLLMINSVLLDFTMTTAITPGEAYTIRLVRDANNDVRCFINGIESSTGAINSTDSFLFLYLFNRALSSAPTRGMIYSFELVGVGKWTANGNWQDAIGSNNGVINNIGTILIPAQTDTLNVLGETLDYSCKAPKDARLVESSCGTFNGTTDKLVSSHLIGTETVISSGGTSTPTVAAGEITFTAGTCYDLLLSDGSHYPIAESAGLVAYDTVNGNHATINAAEIPFWATTQDLYHYNLLNGFHDGLSQFPYFTDFTIG